MPGPYAHITLLHELMQPDRLKSIFSPTFGGVAALVNYFPYCLLGAVSPDYPNLAFSDLAAPPWADAMHCRRACEMMTSGISRVRDAKGDVRNKQLAWLLGYCAHVATDVTIHPVVQGKVGVYAENRRHHRICEMNQDSYIYRRMNIGEIGESDLFAQRVARCGTPSDRTRLDGDIVTLWEGMLEDVHPELFGVQRPDSSSWHREFVAMADGDIPGTVTLFPLARTIATEMDAAYPAYNVVDRQYIDELTIPSKTPRSLHYDDVFDHAADNVAALWKLMERAVCVDTPNLPTFGEWNLDNGLDEFGRLVFWD